MGVRLRSGKARGIGWIVRGVAVRIRASVRCMDRRLYDTIRTRPDDVYVWQAGYGDMDDGAHVYEYIHSFVWFGWVGDEPTILWHAARHSLCCVALHCIGMVFCNIVLLRTRDDVKIS